GIERVGSAGFGSIGLFSALRQAARSLGRFARIPTRAELELRALSKYKGPDGRVHYIDEQGLRWHCSCETGIPESEFGAPEELGFRNARNAITTERQAILEEL